MEFINCTSHEISVYNNGELVLHLDPAERSARVRNRKTNITTVNEVPVAQNMVFQVENLPKPQLNTMYVVSGFVRNVMDHRDDLVSPDTSHQSLIKDKNGEIRGIKRLVGA